MSGNSDTIQRLQQSPSIPKAQSNLQVPVFNGSQMGTQMRPNLSSPEMSKRPGIPPSHPNNHQVPLPYSQIMASRPPSPQPPGPSHSRSLSQPPIFDSLPPLSPISTDVSMEERVAVVNSHSRSIPSPVNRVGESLPPRRGHRRSSSDNVPLGFNAMIQSSPQLIPIGSRGGVLDRSVSGRESNSGVEKPIQLVKRESEWNKDGNSNAEGMNEKKSEGEVVDDLFSAYMNLDNFDTLTSSGTEDKDFDSRASGSKTNGGESSDNEVESGVNGNFIGLHGTSSSVLTEKREGVKRSATGDIAPTGRHYRSVSMDSYMGDLHFDDELPKLPPPGTQVGLHSPGNSLDGNSTKMSLDFLSSEFSEAEMKKIIANEKLAEVAVSDPKRAKRILANRLSAARSKERKMRYIVELEHKVQTLQTEATTLSAQLTVLQRDSSGLTSQNNELKFRLQAMEQQAQLKDALNNTLAEEVQRLKLANAELDREVHLSNCIAQQLSINNQMFQLQHQQPSQLNVYQLQHQQPQQQEQQPQHNQLQQPQQQNGETAS